LPIGIKINIFVANYIHNLKNPFLMKHLLLLAGLFSLSGLCLGQNAPTTNQKAEIIPSSCLPNQICCYYNTHTSAGWDLKCLTREECEKLSGTIFEADKCLAIPEEKTEKEAPKKSNKK